ncbi:MAG: aminopeptidase P family protein [Candidatus Kapaibacteriales bacterium]
MSKKTTQVKLSAYPELIDKRLEQIRFRIGELHVDGLWINYLPNIKYITNFSGSEASVIVLSDSILFFTDDRYAEQVQTELYPLPNLQIHITRDVWNYLVEKKILKGIGSLAFESDRVSYQDVINIRNIIRPIKFKPAPSIVEPFTQPKAKEELESISKACQIAEKTFNEILNVYHPKMTERDLANEIVYLSRKNGSEGEPFPTIVVSGKRSSMPHGSPSSKEIKNGEVITVDFGCIVNGFCCDITRVFALGKATKEQISIYNLLLNAKDSAISKIRPFVNGKFVDEVARNIIKNAKYGDFFQHSLGHGIGVVPHELPLITFRKNDQIIPENCVLAIEPGVYLPNKFGLRLEDDVYVTRDGAVYLTKSPSEMPIV